MCISTAVPGPPPNNSPGVAATVAQKYNVDGWTILSGSQYITPVVLRQNVNKIMAKWMENHWACLQGSKVTKCSSTEQVSRW